MNKLLKNAKEIPNFPGYFATLEGKIWSNKRRKGFLKPLPDSGGYYMVGLYKKGKRFYRLIHQLILETFVGPKPKNYEGCHYDGDRINNELKNLRWDTKSNNQKDAVKHGTNGLKILNKLQVRIIRHLLKFKTLTQKEIGSVFNVKPAHISNIKYNRKWRGI